MLDSTSDHVPTNKLDEGKELIPVGANDDDINDITCLLKDISEPVLSDIAGDVRDIHGLAVLLVLHQIGFVGVAVLAEHLFNVEGTDTVCRMAIESLETCECWDIQKNSERGAYIDQVALAVKLRELNEDGGSNLQRLGKLWI